MGINIRKRFKAVLDTAEKTFSEQVQVWVDICGVVGGKHLLIQGWAFHPEHESLDFHLEYIGSEEESDTQNIEDIKYYTLRTTRLDVNKHFNFEGDSCWGYSLLVEWPYDRAVDNKLLCMTVSANGQAKEIELKPFIELSGEALFGHCMTWRTGEKAELLSAMFESMGNKVFEIPGLKKLEEGQLKTLVDWHWDSILAVPGHGLFLSGWLLDGQRDLASLVLRTTDGSYSKNLLEESARFARVDVLEAFPGRAEPNYKAGFFTWVPMPHLIERAGLELLFFTKEGHLGVVPLQQTNIREDITQASQQVLVNFNVDGREYRDNMRKHIGPALSALWVNRRFLLEEPKVEVLQFGQKVKEPKRSVIVPLYGRYDFLLHQIAQFTEDTDFAETELIYVLDDPRLYDAFIPFCYDTSKLFPVNFKVIYGGRNLGYAGANNLGARYASADKLVLLNSDIIPSSSGWISRIEQQASSLEDVGVVAPKLVFDDGTIQHVGMTFSKSAQFGNLWLNEHPGKGNPEWLVDIDSVMESPAVTGACMFISKALYDLVGGLDETYVLGDFEDSDLCLQLRKAGYRHYVLTDEKLYHLERMSQNLFENRDWKFKITLYNAWQHTERWGSLIEQLVR
ncbi:glycosyltransferase family 2 protein [Microbulbifer sp. THAF38]|uniref:glycosyltransferase family 2 protein n=1 Tax=Microbulbifer sp. THAF38 TaxID=2587856 RepID=UPI001267B306|nr:glycosyltransferase family 2 protein [Microbulbifer sp. THAF38]QFT53788.1 Glycosyl transferase family 2 [Microbulbifer sp. THAF38]